MELTAEELNDRFKGKIVKIHGLHPGKDCMSYKHKPSLFEKAYSVKWDGGQSVGFCATAHVWPGIDYWREGANGELYGFYTAGMYPDTEPGFVCIKLAGEPDTKNG